MALRGAGDHEPGVPEAQQPAVAAVEGRGIAERGASMASSIGEGRGVADDGAHVVDGDGPGVGRIEAELGDLGAADHAVGADQALERGRAHRR